MDTESELYKQNPWWEGKFKEKSIERRLYLDEISRNIKTKEIIFLTGLRRVGKTTIMRQMIGRLLSGGTKPDDIFFLSVDSFNLLGLTIHQLIEEYRRVHKKPASGFFYLFLDEVTSKENFSQELKSIYDSENIKVICSSSIATMMRDRKALLTGRTKTIEVMPLTFQEFLAFKRAEAGRADSAILEGHFRDYLRSGGIPYYVLSGDKSYLNELVESIIYKDIIAYHKITGERAVKELFVLLCNRVGKPTSYNKLSKILKISVDSVKRYVGYFEKAYLFYVVDRHSGSASEKATSPKKIYIGDVGIKNLITECKDLGASYENLVFLSIKDRNPEYYLENGVEIDFITKDAAIEAKYNQEPSEKQNAAMKSIKRKKKTVANGYGFFVRRFRAQ